MPEFTLYCINNEGSRSEFFYNNDTSNLYNFKRELVNTEVVNEPPLRVNRDSFTKDLSCVRHFRLKFTDSCNFRCSYCLQPHDVDNYSGVDIDKLLDSLPIIYPVDSKIGLWGGEPLTRWDVLSQLIVGIKKRNITAPIHVVTNGSLIKRYMSDFFSDYGISISISHDGPEQSTRGQDPLVGKQQEEIQYLFNLLNPRGLFSFNAMLTSINSSRERINNWFLKEIGHNQFNMGEGKFIYPMVSEHTDLCFSDERAMKSFALNNLKEIRHNKAPNIEYSRRAIQILRDSFLYHRKSDSPYVISGCGLHIPFRVDADTLGNVLTCQNFPADQTMPSGHTNKIGELGKNTIIEFPLLTWREFDSCKNCLVLHLCQGGCPSNLGSELKALECNNNFADGIGFFATVIEQMTGYLPYYVEGPLPEDRKELFGTSLADDLFSV